VSVDGATRIGSAGAKVALIQYFDFECPYCKKFALDVLPGLRAKYVDSGRAAFFWRHLPLRSHAFAVPAAEAAVCAERMGRFAEAHDFLFRSSQLSDALRTLPAALTGPAAAFGRCRAEIGAPAVAKDQASANALGIASTPSFLVGRIQADGAVKVTRALRGVREIADFEEALDSAVTVVSGRAREQNVR
jgi:protein-disulfide isomerase